MTIPAASRDFAVDVVMRLRDAGYDALWAGGCVRDVQLGRIPGDYDVATNATPDQVREVFGQRRTIPVGASFGVMIVRGPRDANQVEVATFRTEGPYADGRRPDHVSFATAEEDAQRRDFTINGMFFDPVAETVIDYVNGEADLRAKVLRAIGDPHHRMTEDKLRMLRAVRFAATLEFTLDETTAAAVREMAGEIYLVSAERIAQELRRMLVDGHRRRAIELSEDVGLREHILPQLDAVVRDDADWQRTLGMLERLSEPRFELAFAALLHGLWTTSDGQQPESINHIARTLRLSNQESHDTVWLVGHQRALDHASDLRASQLKPLLAHPLACELIALCRARAEATASDLAQVEFCETYLRDTPMSEIDPPPLLTGDDLIDLGLQPGRRFKELLTQVRDMQLDDELSSREDAIAFVQRS